MLDTIKAHLKKLKPIEDQHEILGKHVALKIRNIKDNIQRTLVEKVIGETFFMVETGQLTMTHAI